MIQKLFNVSLRILHPTRFKALEKPFRTRAAWQIDLKALQVP